MISTILDKTLVEQMVMGFRESELQFPEFELIDVERDGNKLVWKFTQEYFEEGVFVGGHLIFQAPVVHLFDKVLFQDRDIINVTYTLTWGWNGGGDTELSLVPTPGAEIQFFSLAA